MKRNTSLKILTILIIIAICLISFVGIFIKDKNQMKNIVSDYMFSMNIEGARVVRLAPDKSTEEIIYDEQGNVAKDGENEDGTLKEGYMKKDERINPDEILTNDNFELVKNIVNKRLSAFGIEDYTLRKNDETGEIIIEISENYDVDHIVYNLEYNGEFTIKDSQTDEVLINNSDIEKSSVVSMAGETGTTVYLLIEFNNEGKQKFEDVTKTYIKTTDEDGNNEIKKISINLDNEKLIETYFGETITNGLLQLSVGSPSTDYETLKSYSDEASQIAALIDSGKMPIKYNIESNNHISSSSTIDILKTVIYVLIAIVIVALIYLCIVYKGKGLLLSISYIGFLGLLLIVLRYTNVLISIETIAGFAILIIANYMFIMSALKNSVENTKKEAIKQTYIKYASILLPLLLISIVFTFIKWVPIASIGMVVFWGLVTMFIYNYLTLNILLNDK